MDSDTQLKTAALAAMWSVSERQARNIVSQLESLGFALETDNYGARLLPLAVATAAKKARQAGLELSSLRDRDDLRPYLRPDADPGDPLSELIEMRAEAAILRVVIGEIYKSVSQGSQRYGYQAPNSWSFLGVPDPRKGL